MEDVAAAIAAAWKRIRPMLARHEQELRRRLARRRGALLQSPPRAWCLAIRASDTRIFDQTRVGLNVGSEAVGGEAVADYPASFSPPPTAHFSPPTSPHAPHRLTLTSSDLHDLCAPVYLDAPGEPLRLVADKLGCSTSALTMSRIKGVFKVHHTPALNGRWGKPHPMLYTSEPLDLASRGFSVPDPLWSITARLIGSRIPSGLRATLTRVPIFRDATRDYRDKSNLHPEHPDVDRTFDTRPRTKSRRLPPPEPDPVAYKWKDGVFVGYDWRAAEKNPLIKQNRDRHQRELARYRDYNRNRRARKPSQSSGSLKFRGWAWLCPRCGGRVNVLFYPLPRLHLLPGKIPRLSIEEERELNRCRPQNHYFACKRCHRIRYFSRVNKGTWGEIVCYLSAGLLYGHEVQRPSWLKPQRKNAYAPKINREPSQRRPQIEQLLLAGLTIKDVAARLGLAQGTVLFYTQSIYARHGVRSLRELYLKNGLALRRGMRGPALGKRGDGRVARRRKTTPAPAPTPAPL